MAWVPYNEQTQVGYFLDRESPNVTEGDEGGIHFYGTEDYETSWWTLVFNEPVLVRITCTEYQAAASREGTLYFRPALIGTWNNDGQETSYSNEGYPYPQSNFPDSVGVPEFLPSVMEPSYTANEVFYAPTYITSDGMPGDNFYSFRVEVWIDEEPPPPPPPRDGFRVYELDKGWSFDGAYIPHFAELNWYFGDDPFTSKSIQKVRIHGLAKGLAQLQLSVAGMQTEYDSDYTEPQFINLPRNMAHISSEYFPVTNYVDSSNWGVSLQLKLEGSNKDLSKPEPSHVLQVLALQGSPQDNGKRSN